MTDVVRYSLLVRNPALDHKQFSEHYEFSHGPLALSQAGFRKYTIEYVQNHCLERVAGGAIEIDGVTATTQLPRPDYAVGFFQEPDYANVQPDERFLFDLGSVRSILAKRDAFSGEGGSHKIFALTRNKATRRLIENVQPKRARVARLDLSTTSALGFGAAEFEYDTVVELWTGELPQFSGTGDDVEAWSVREVVMIPMDKPERPEAA